VVYIRTFSVVSCISKPLTYQSYYIRVYLSLSERFMVHILVKTVMMILSHAQTHSLIVLHIFMYIILNWRLIACDRIKRRQAAVPEMDVSFFYW